MLDPALYYWLANTASTVIALVGARIWPAGEVPQSKILVNNVYLTSLTYQTIDDPQVRHMSGDSVFASTRVQFNCIAETQKAASELAAALKADLNTYSGTMDPTGSAVVVEGAFLESQHDDFEQPTDASQRGPQRVIADYIIWHRG